MGDEEKPKLKLTLKLGELVNEIEDDREKHKEHKKKKKKKEKEKHKKKRREEKERKERAEVLVLFLFWRMLTKSPGIFYPNKNVKRQIELLINQSS